MVVIYEKHLGGLWVLCRLKGSPAPFAAIPGTLAALAGAALEWYSQRDPSLHALFASAIARAALLGDDSELPPEASWLVRDAEAALDAAAAGSDRAGAGS